VGSENPSPAAGAMTIPERVTRKLAAAAIEKLERKR
jgi:hypothetical protein